MRRKIFHSVPRHRIFANYSQPKIEQKKPLCSDYRMLRLCPIFRRIGVFLLYSKNLGFNFSLVYSFCRLSVINDWHPWCLCFQFQNFGHFHPIGSLHLFCYAIFYKIIDHFGIVFPTEKNMLLLWVNWKRLGTFWSPKLSPKDSIDVLFLSNVKTL